MLGESIKLVRAIQLFEKLVKLVTCNVLERISEVTFETFTSALFVEEVVPTESLFESSGNS